MKQTKSKQDRIRQQRKDRVLMKWLSWAPLFLVIGGVLWMVVSYLIHGVPSESFRLRVLFFFVMTIVSLAILSVARPVLRDEEQAEQEQEEQEPDTPDSELQKSETDSDRVGYLREFFEGKVPAAQKCGFPHPEKEGVACEMRIGHPADLTHHAGSINLSYEWDEDNNVHHLNGQPRPSIEQVAWMLAHMDDHFLEGGSFRVMIYRRLGFTHDAYTSLYLAGGMNVTNAIFEYQEFLEKYGNMPVIMDDYLALKRPNFVVRAFFSLKRRLRSVVTFLFPPTPPSA